MEDMDQQPGNRDEIRDFLASRRARITPVQVGLPASTRRRVAGLRREEVAVLAGVSTEWYTRLEKGHIGGVSEEVLDAVARALRLDDDERTYLFDLARSSRPASCTRSRRRDVEVPPQVQWLLDSMTMSSAFVRNGRTDVVASNALARAVYAPMFDSSTVDQRGHPNIVRYIFLDPGAHDFLSSSTPVRTISSSTGTPPAMPLRPCCAQRPDASPTTGRCANSSASCARSAPSSATSGPRTTS